MKPAADTGRATTTDFSGNAGSQAASQKDGAPYSGRNAFRGGKTKRPKGRSKGR